MSAEDAVKAIRIKTGSLRRLFKERAMYAEEVTSGEAKVAAMKRENADDGDIKQQENVLEESAMMVQDNATRLHDALGSLQVTVEHFESDAMVEASEEYAAAVVLLKEVEDALRK